jgi:flagellin
MGLRIKTNIESITAQRRLGESRKQITESMEKLSSGQRINKSADDAAGLAISQSIVSTTKSLGVAKRNASDGISYIQVTEGGLQEISNIIIRMRELASQSASDTLGNRERSFLDKEFQQLRQEVTRIVDSTEFNGTKVLRMEDVKPIQIFVGASNRGTDIEGNVPEFDAETDPDVLTINLEELANLNENLEVFKDADLLKVVPDDIEGTASELGSEGTNAVFNKLDTSLSAIASFRATVGAVQSRLQSTINNIEVANENLQAAQSRIRDVDFASETSNFVQSKILTTAGVSVLTQANTTPEYALQLLRGGG